MNRQEAEALIKRQARAWEHADSDAVVADFAPDGILISPSGRWQGHDSLRNGIESFFAEARDIQVAVTRVLIDGDQGAVEWTWSETRLSTGRRHSADDAIIFTVRDGKITYWREYIDAGEDG